MELVDFIRNEIEKKQEFQKELMGGKQWVNMKDPFNEGRVVELGHTIDLLEDILWRAEGVV